jgi:hypothetical protein
VQIAHVKINIVAIELASNQLTQELVLVSCAAVHAQAVTKAAAVIASHLCVAVCKDAAHCGIAPLVLCARGNRAIAHLLLTKVITAIVVVVTTIAVAQARREIVERHARRSHCRVVVGALINTLAIVALTG